MMYKVVAYQIAENIDVRKFRSDSSLSTIYYDGEEFFFEKSENKYVSVFKYGAVCFFNLDEKEIADNLNELKNYSARSLEKKFDEEFIIDTDSTEDVFGHSKISISKPSREAIRLIMLNVAHSSALDYFAEQTRKLMETTQYHTQLLEKKGKLGLPTKKMKKYIGRTLNVKNQVAANLYIFDSPLVTWDNEYLDHLNIELKKTFELQPRYRVLKEEIGIIKENLELFKDLMQHKTSEQLEWIIILLILVEVLNLFVEKLF